MKNVHLSEEEIQAIVFEKRDFSSNEHLQHCTRCKNSIEAYKLISTALAHHQPVFDFQVQSPLPVRSQEPQRNLSYIPVFAFAVSAFVLLALGALDYVFKEQLEKFDQTIPLNWFIIFMAAILLVGLLIDLATGYEKKIKALNRSIMQH